ncbi:TPA: PcfJ domain-containing protein [Burkholderia vietnamiensis]|uniref:PcfJ domain-containing protein n=1 Tax=Burkholderia vietnamiensis TaxID=60552 RepID=UPI00298A75BC|nr:PcfJ domain-containing protein [Burkholderia vietnamiensis]
MTEGVPVRRTFDKVRAAEPLSTETRSAATHRFGDARIAAVYAQAKRYIIDRQVLRLYQKLTLRPGVCSIIICNTWRIDKALDSCSVELFQWSFLSAQWEPSSDLDSWPDFQLLPIVLSKKKADDPSNELWQTILRKALWQVLDGAGYGDLPARPEDGVKQMSRRTMAEILINFYIAPKRKAKRRQSATKLRIKPPRFAAAARALRKNIWTNVIDRSVLSAVAIIKGWDARVTIRDYLRYAAAGADVTRMLMQNRNCLPLLARIKPQHWKRTDLFSRHLWVRDGRKTTIIDRSGFCDPIHLYGARAAKRLSSFVTPAAHRWLMRAPVSVVSEFSMALNADVIENLAQCNLPKRVPAVVLRTIIKNSRRLGVRPEYQRLYRAWANRCCEIWSAQGYGYFRENMRTLTNEFRDVLDWVYWDGLARGLPDKNSTWQSMMRQSADWHLARRTAREIRTLRWESLLPICEIDGYRVLPLTSSEALYVEGYQMHHCVGSYDSWCADGEFRIFSLVDPEGMRSTLCIEQTDAGRWQVQQVRGTCNASVSKVTHAIARIVAKRYSEAVVEQIENRQ